MLTLYNHGGSENHGCEAIVRATARILDVPIQLLSANPGQDLAYGLDAVCKIHPDQSTPLPGAVSPGFCLPWKQS